jgi:PAS domain S-box-containing protein
LDSARATFEALAIAASAVVDRYFESDRILERDALLGQAPGVLCMVDHAGNLRMAGLVLRCDLGHSHLANFQSLSDLLHPSDRIKWAEGAPFPGAMEARLRDHSGAWHPYRLFFREVPSSDSILVTAQPGSILADSDGEKQYRALFEHATDMLYTHDLSGRLTLFNQTAERLTGCPRRVALTKNIRELVAADHHEVLSQALQRLLGGEPVTKYRLEILMPSGKRCPVEVSSRLIFDAGRPAGVQSAGRDLRERQKLEAQLLHAQKMEAIGRLAGGVAHDFNNLLTVIGGYTQWILDELGHEHPLWDAAHEAMLATDRASRLTNQLLAFSRMQVVKLEALDLNTVVARIERMVRRVIGEDVELQISMAPHIWQVRADAGQIEQVLLNLCVNSRDALPNGGMIRIETSNVSLDVERASMAGVPPGDYVLLKVSDNGCGMDEETRTRAFEPFFTTKEMGKGTGLGLSIVYGIVRQSEGYITVESGSGEGTSICTYLPRHVLPVACGAPDLYDYPANGTETVLLVEDESSVRRMISEMLIRLGYSVLEAPDGKTAYELLRVTNERIHVLLTDVIMPEMGGQELAEAARGLQPDLRVLYISGYTDDTLLSARTMIPGVSLINKPFTPQTLARKIREVLDSPCAP